MDLLLSCAVSELLPSLSAASSLKGLSRPPNRRRHGNRWKILTSTESLMGLRWRNTFGKGWTGQKESWANSGIFCKWKKDDVGTFLLWTYAITINLWRFMVGLEKVRLLNSTEWVEKWFWEVKNGQPNKKLGEWFKMQEKWTKMIIRFFGME